MNWHRLFIRCLCSMACLALASLGVAAIDIGAGDAAGATWCAVTAFELLMLGSIAFIVYAMILL